MKSRLSMRSFAHVLAAGALAVMLVLGLSLLFSRLQVRARLAPESVVLDAAAAPSILTPTSQTRSPEKGALIVREGVFTIEGVAWLGNNRPPFPGDPVLSPIDNDGEPNYVVDWTEAVSGTYYVLYEADNPYFEDQTAFNTDDKTEKFIFEQPQGTYYYRVKSYNAEGASRWSNVESVTVGADVSAMAAESRGLAAGESITVWVRVDAGAWHAASLTEAEWGGWRWSHDWNLPEDESYQQHAIHTKATAEGIEGPTDTITVTVNNGAYRVYLPLVAKRWPAVPYPPDLSPIDNPDLRVSYTLDWSYSDGKPEVPDPTSYTLQEATDPSFVDPTTYSTNATEFTITDPGKEKEGGRYYYRVRGHNRYGPGEWSHTRATTVRVVPYAPALQSIDNADGDDSYTVQWTYGHTYPSVDTFILQEATDQGFSDDVNNYTLDGATTSRAFTNKDNETYYYRVKARNEYGDGPWSAMRSVTSVSADFFDDFTDPDSGWMTHEAECCLSGCDSGLYQEHPEYKYNLFYGDGRYHVHIPLDCRAAGSEHGDTRHIYPLTFAPGVERPETRTCIELKGGFEEWDPFWAFWGLVFAASEDKSTVYSLEVNNHGNWAVVKRTGYDFPGPNHPFDNEDRLYLVPYLPQNEPREPARPAFEGNTLRVEVNGVNVKLYINGVMVHQFSDSEIDSLTRVGIIGGDYEITPTQIGYDHFYLDVGCDDF